jgi:hypothetical protein
MGAAFDISLRKIFMRNGRKHQLALRFITLLSMISMLAASSADAQPRLTFNHISVKWPTVELYYRVICDRIPVYSAGLKDFSISENGVDLTADALWCPDPSAHCPVSVALVFDASASMSGIGNVGAKRAGHAFVDMMDGVVDEASVLYFTSAVTVMQPMTNDRMLLRSAVDVLPASGQKAAWDGAYAGLIEVINNGINQCRAVILLTDGADQASTRTPDDVISLANRHLLRVFTIGLGSSIDDAQLERIADSTGGRYYRTPNAGQLAAIYMEISSMVFQNHLCILSYQADCMDGSLRYVELLLDNVCGGSDIQARTYRAPLDSSTFSTLYMELGSSLAGAGMDATVPLRLITPVSEIIFHPFQFSLTFDTAVVELRGVMTRQSSLLEGVPVSWTPTASGATIQTNAAALISGSGTLLELMFRTKMRMDSVCAELKPSAAAFTLGCFTADIMEGRVCIKAGTPLITCDISGPSRLEWCRGDPDYCPNPFTIEARFSNSGDTEALQPRYTITYDSTTIQLYSPKTGTQPSTMGVIGPHSSEHVIWHLRAIHRSVGDTARICITASFDNHPDVTCCIQVYIPKIGPILDCWFHAPEITVDSANLRYDPMPFTLTLTVGNVGPSSIDSVYATLDLPVYLELAGADAPDAYTKPLSPATVAPGETATVDWQLQHPRSVTAREYFVRARLNTEGADSARRLIRIPALPVPTFPFTLTALGPRVCCQGDSVMLDAGAGYTSYHWSDGSRGRILAAKKSGYYNCTVERADGSLGVSDTVRVSVIWNPTPRIAVRGSNPVCENDSVQLDAGGAYASYLWNTGATEQTITVRSAGAYFVRVRSSYDCEGYSDTMIVTTKATPSKPGIRRNLDWLIAEGDVGAFYWYRDGMVLPDSGYSSIRIRETGRYQLRVRFMNGCSEISDPFDVTVLDVEGVAPTAVQATLTAYPEPATHSLHIKLTDAGEQTVILALYDVLGRAEVIHSGPLTAGNAEFTHPLHDVKPGVYYLVALLGETVLVRRVTRI